MPAPRETIRGLTPSSVQDYIRANCYRQTTLVEHSMIDCPPAVPDAEARAMLGGFVADPTLLMQLRYWHAQVRILNIVSATERSAAEVRVLGAGCTPQAALADQHRLEHGVQQLVPAGRWRQLHDLAVVHGALLVRDPARGGGRL